MTLGEYSVYKGSAQKVFPRSACGDIREAISRSLNGEDERVLASDGTWTVICDIVAVDGAAASRGVVEELIAKSQSHNFTQGWAHSIASLIDLIFQNHGSQLLDLLYSSTAKRRPLEVTGAKPQEALNAPGTTGYTSR